MDKYDHYCAILNQCDKELDELYHKYAVHHHLSDAALWILYAIYDANEMITQSDICNTWFFTRQTIHTALKGLEQQGIIEVTSIPTNKKSKQLHFTKDGKQTAQQLLTPLLEAEKNVFTAFSDEENELYAQLSKKRCTLLRDFLEENFSRNEKKEN